MSVQTKIGGEVHHVLGCEAAGCARTFRAATPLVAAVDEARRYGWRIEADADVRLVRRVFCPMHSAGRSDAATRE